MMRTILVALLVLLGPVSGLAQQTPQSHPGGDCCWGVNCAMNPLIHSAEMNPDIKCSNHNAQNGVGTFQGHCLNDWTGPSWSFVKCDEDGIQGCIVTGVLKCVNPNGQGGYNVTYPSYNLPCFHRTINGKVVDGFVSAWQDEAQCLYADGKGQAVGCLSDGTAGMVSYLSSGVDPEDLAMSTHGR